MLGRAGRASALALALAEKLPAWDRKLRAATLDSEARERLVAAMRENEALDERDEIARSMGAAATAFSPSAPRRRL